MNNLETTKATVEGVVLGGFLCTSDLGPMAPAITRFLCGLNENNALLLVLCKYEPALKCLSTVKVL